MEVVCAMMSKSNETDKSLGDIHIWGKWQPTIALLPEKSHGESSLVGHSPEGCKELDTIELFLLLITMNYYLIY